MKQIPLTRGAYAVVDDEDYEWLNDLTGWCLSTYGYAELKKRGLNVKMHRLIMFARPGQLIDHINGDRLDNRKANLRFCTTSQNSRNRKKLPNKSSIYKGVFWNKTDKAWHVFMQINDKLTYIGRFRNELYAAMAYDIWARDLFAEFAKLNFTPISKSLL